MSGLVKNRRRNQTISFRMSPEERRRLEARIMVSGMPKGQYFIESLLHQEIHIAVGKYQNDRLSLELRRLRETIEAISFNKDEDISNLLCDCEALLDQLLLVVTQEENTEIRAGGYMMENQ